MFQRLKIEAEYQNVAPETLNSQSLGLIFTSTTAATSKWIIMFSSVFSCALNEFDL